jgi:hypothetical protein
MKTLLQAAWRLVIEPIYDRLFRRYFQASISRLNTTIDYVSGIQAELAEVHARLDELDAHVRTVVAARWENAALARRIAMLEEQLDGDRAARATDETPEVHEA